jgi:hypothetical protein
MELETERNAVPVRCLKGAMNECKISGEKGGELEWHPLLLFVSLRLGLAEINPVYIRQTNLGLAAQTFFWISTLV